MKTFLLKIFLILLIQHLEIEQVFKRIYKTNLRNLKKHLCVYLQNLSLFLISFLYIFFKSSLIKKIFIVIITFCIKYIKMHIKTCLFTAKYVYFCIRKYTNNS